MKQLLTLLGSISLVATTSVSVIACGDKTQQKSPEKKDDKLLSPKKEENEITKEKINELQSDKPKEDNIYHPKKSIEENFNLLKKYGLKISDFIFPRIEKLDQLKKHPEYNYLWEITSKVTKFYNEIVKYTNFDDFKDKSKSRLINEEIHKEFDRAISQYEKEEQKIWDLLNLIK
ncbi:lipoprotein [Mycoplasma mycoides subsp. capri]|uniref:lipoprotein n=1 Tax=Mycoplasma mycoides TaxID=2102 RepID=UPI00223FBA83|nr:lipoprotein [Mycoplasma mycoides]QVJ96586.1 lipoprotein [Mycoplasma mycoides subsp. capri]QVJ97477.1 lipoprotein [Mycoplasma mycoides subsp. capri]QVK00469.1 lipoprotein [Mycoplasma mycoides subsp. capri]QVK01356.1 lipoprotein [Mycoplasma mycoides subsp. capri]